MALIECRECGAEISSTASACPRCGAKTEHGKSQTQSMVDLVSLLLLFAGSCLGIYWFLANIKTVAYIAEFFERYEYYSKYYDYGILEYLEYKYADEAIGALFEFIAGIALIVGGLIGMRSLKREVEKRKSASVRVISSYYKTNSPQPQKTSSNTRWECEQCHSTNPPAAMACTRCGAKRPAAISKNEETVTCPECGDTHKKGVRFCTGCGTKLED